MKRYVHQTVDNRAFKNGLIVEGKPVSIILQTRRVLLTLEQDCDRSGRPRMVLPAYRLFSREPGDLFQAGDTFLQTIRVGPRIENLGYRRLGSVATGEAPGDA